MLPQDIEKRKRIAADIERGVNILNEVDMLLSDVEDLASTLQDEDVIKAKAFKDLLKARYEGQKLLDKAKQKLSEVEDNLTSVEILSKLNK
jgi:ElaB/YqjD/DUF883 family membrane-anchored ribosome-binding protein